MWKFDGQAARMITTKKTQTGHQRIHTYINGNDDLFMSGLCVDYEWVMSEPRSKRIKDAENRRGNR